MPQLSIPLKRPRHRTRDRRTPPSVGKADGKGSPSPSSTSKGPAGGSSGTSPLPTGNGCDSRKESSSSTRDVDIVPPATLEANSDNKTDVEICASTGKAVATLPTEHHSESDPAECRDDDVVVCEAGDEIEVYDRADGEDERGAFEGALPTGYDVDGAREEADAPTEALLPEERANLERGAEEVVLYENKNDMRSSHRVVEPSPLAQLEMYEEMVDSENRNDNERAVEVIENYDALVDMYKLEQRQHVDHSSVLSWRKCGENENDIEMYEQRHDAEDERRAAALPPDTHNNDESRHRKKSSILKGLQSTVTGKMRNRAEGEKKATKPDRTKRMSSLRPLVTEVTEALADAMSILTSNPMSIFREEAHYRDADTDADTAVDTAAGDEHSEAGSLVRAESLVAGSLASSAASVASEAGSLLTNGVDIDIELVGSVLSNGDDADHVDINADENGEDNAFVYAVTPMCCICPVTVPGDATVNDDATHNDNATHNATHNAPIKRLPSIGLNTLPSIELDPSECKAEAGPRIEQPPNTVQIDEVSRENESHQNLEDKISMLERELSMLKEQMSMGNDSGKRTNEEKKDANSVAESAGKKIEEPKEVDSIGSIEKEKSAKKTREQPSPAENKAEDLKAAVSTHSFEKESRAKVAKERPMKEISDVAPKPAKYSTNRSAGRNTSNSMSLTVSNARDGNGSRPMSLNVTGTRVSETPAPTGDDWSIQTLPSAMEDEGTVATTKRMKNFFSAAKGRSRIPKVISVDRESDGNHLPIYHYPPVYQYREEEEGVAVEDVMTIAVWQPKRFCETMQLHTSK